MTNFAALLPLSISAAPKARCGKNLWMHPELTYLKPDACSLKPKDREQND